MAEYKRPDPDSLMGEREASKRYGEREFCKFCERIHRPGWFFADCLNLQWDAIRGVISEGENG